MKKGFIYQLVSSSNKIYIGQTINFKKRMSEYKTFHHCENQKKLFNALKKYGFDNFKIEIIETIECSTIEELKDKLNELEIFYIKEYKCIECGYNICVGGSQHRLGVRETEEQKKKKKDVWTLEKRLAKSEQLKGKGNHRFGKKYGRSHLAKYINQYDLQGNFIKTHDSIMSITSTTFTVEGKIIDYRNVSAVLRGIGKTVGGYIWKYKEDIL